MGLDADSDVGRRLEERARSIMTADLVTLDRLQRVYVESLSTRGAGLLVEDLPAVGSEVVLAWSAYDIAGTVAWAADLRCGVTFSRVIPLTIVEEIIRTSGGRNSQKLAHVRARGSFAKLGKI